MQIPGLGRRPDRQYPANEPLNNDCGGGETSRLKAALAGVVMACDGGHSGTNWKISIPNTSSCAWRDRRSGAGRETSARSDQPHDSHFSACVKTPPARRKLPLRPHLCLPPSPPSFVLSPSTRTRVRMANTFKNIRVYCQLLFLCTVVDRWF
jgi:hypothetical protein